MGYALNAARIFNVGVAGQPLYRKYGKTAGITIRQAGYGNNYNRLQVKLDRRFSSGFLMTTAYTWDKAMGYASESGGLTYYINERRNYARLNFDRTQTFVQSYVYELPIGKGKRWLQSGLGRWVLGDWQVNGLLTLMTGSPLNFGTTTSIDTPGNGNSPDITGPTKILHGIAGPSGSALWFDTSVFVRPLDADGKTPHFGKVTGTVSGNNGGGASPAARPSSPAAARGNDLDFMNLVTSKNSTAASIVLLQGVADHASGVPQAQNWDSGDGVLGHYAVVLDLCDDP
ncbi:MAG: hypothetical protein AAB225_14425 [Acidobacteriota bacterium]